MDGRFCLIELLRWSYTEKAPTKLTIGQSALLVAARALRLRLPMSPFAPALLDDFFRVSQKTPCLVCGKAASVASLPSALLVAGGLGTESAVTVHISDRG
jgi:hypothetical protein